MLTSIGSWPGASIEDALDWAFALDLPAMPELPQLGAGQDMIGRFLGEAPAARDAFLARVDRLRPNEAKMQSVGPITLSELARRGDPRLRGQRPSELEARVRTRVHEDLRALMRAGAAPVIYFDEPLLFAAPAEIPRLGPMIAELQRTGARVGLHSCGPMPWRPVFELGLDFIAFDATQIAWPLPSPEALARFRARRGRLVLGALSLSRSASIVTLRARFGDEVDLSFSCGLAGASPAHVSDLSRRLEELRQRFVHDQTNLR